MRVLYKITFFFPQKKHGAKKMCARSVTDRVVIWVFLLFPHRLDRPH